MDNTSDNIKIENEWFWVENATKTHGTKIEPSSTCIFADLKYPCINEELKYTRWILKGIYDDMGHVIHISDKSSQFAKPFNGNLHLHNGFDINPHPRQMPLCWLRPC
jgi:hypothetical protein